MFLDIVLSCFRFRFFVFLNEGKKVFQVRQPNCLDDPNFLENIQGLLEPMEMDACLSSLGQAAPRPVPSQLAASGVL